MSIESAKAFIDRIKNDEDFRKKVSDCKDSEARKSFVKKEGFDFSMEELKSTTNELSDEDLEVAGGQCYMDYKCHSECTNRSDGTQWCR